MTLASQMLADLNDRINDVGNTQIPEVDKLRYLSHGIRAMWPKIYRTVQDNSIVLAVDTYEYAIPGAVGDNAMITRIDIESNVGTNRYMPLDDLEILPVHTGKTLIIDYLPSYVGSRIRIVSAKMLSPLSAPADVYDGPPGTEEIPVWYALGIIMDRRHEDRLDYTRYNTVAAQNGVDVTEVMNSSQFCFAQFDVLCDRYEMPLPSRVG